MGKTKAYKLYRKELEKTTAKIRNPLATSCKSAQAKKSKGIFESLLQKNLSEKNRR